jgi:DNA-binding transcriptional regulator YiaG
VIDTDPTTKRRIVMKCESCGVEMVEVMATADAPYAYTLSGMKDVLLAGILLHKCPQCGEQSAVIPRIEELNNVITEALVKKPVSLNGDEIRFLRKHAGIPAREFSSLLGIDASHLSRVENGHTPSLGPQTDRLARFIVIASTRGGEMARVRLLEVARLLALRRKARIELHRPTFTLGLEGWKMAA